MIVVRPMRCYAVPIVLVLWALLLTAGLPLTALVVVFLLLAVAGACLVYIAEIRRRIRDGDDHWRGM